MTRAKHVSALNYRQSLVTGSPQARAGGFASTEEGNFVVEEAPWTKLGAVLDLAQEIWSQS